MNKRKFIQFLGVIAAGCLRFFGLPPLGVKKPYATKVEWTIYGKPFEYHRSSRSEENGLIINHTKYGDVLDYLPEDTKPKDGVDPIDYRTKRFYPDTSQAWERVKEDEPPT